MYNLSLSYQTPLQNTKYQDGKKNLLWVRYFYWFGKKTVGLVWSEKKYGSAFFFFTCLSILEIVKTYIIIVIYAFIHSFLIGLDQF